MTFSSIESLMCMHVRVYIYMHVFAYIYMSVWGGGGEGVLTNIGVHQLGPKQMDKSYSSFFSLKYRVYLFC